MLRDVNKQAGTHNCRRFFQIVHLIRTVVTVLPDVRFWRAGVPNLQNRLNEGLSDGIFFWAGAY